MTLGWEQNTRILRIRKCSVCLHAAFFYSRDCDGNTKIRGTNTCFVFRLQYITENNLWKYFFGTEICKIIVLRAQKWYSNIERRAENGSRITVFVS